MPTFTRATPTAITEFVVTFAVSEPGPAATMTFGLVLRDADGTAVAHIHGDLAPYLTPATLSWGKSAWMVQ